MRRLGVVFLTAALAASSLQAALVVNGLNGEPGSVVASQIFTVWLTLQNTDGDTVTDVRPSIGQTTNGFQAVLVSGPDPAALTMPGFSNAAFTWAFSGTGCGSAQFTASAQGTINGTPVVSGDSGPYMVTLFCTPTPTPTPTPDYTATATPWVIYGTPTVVPSEGWAGIPGNLYHPLRDGNLQLQAMLPEAGKLRVDLYDRLGRKVRTLEQDAGPGAVSLDWDGRGDDGLMVSSGIYVARFTARGFSRNVKFAVIK